jgi:hypothetical protein
MDDVWIEDPITIPLRHALCIRSQPAGSQTRDTASMSDGADRVGVLDEERAQ